MLISVCRMDELACFIEPVDDSFAPGYSKIILRPMSFSVMARKARNGEYPLVKDLLVSLLESTCQMRFIFRNSFLQL